MLYPGAVGDLVTTTGRYPLLLNFRSFVGARAFRYVVLSMKLHRAAANASLKRQRDLNASCL